MHEVGTPGSLPREVAQLRWFLVDGAARGAGLGRRLLDGLAAHAAAKFAAE